MSQVVTVGSRLSCSTQGHRIRFFWTVIWSSVSKSVIWSSSVFRLWSNSNFSFLCPPTCLFPSIPLPFLSTSSHTACNAFMYLFTLYSCISWNSCNIIFSSTPADFKWPLSFDFPAKIMCVCVCFYNSKALKCSQEFYNFNNLFSIFGTSDLSHVNNK